MGKIRAWKKFLFYLIIILCFYVLFESAAFIFYSAVNRRFFLPSQFQSERSARSAGVPGQPFPGERGISYLDREAGHQHRKAYEVIHPYLGYVRDPTKMRGYSEYGFSGEEPPIASKTDNSLIVGIFGGSFSMALSKFAGPVLIDELKQSPQFADKEIKIHTVALAGYKQPQQLLTLVYFLSLGAHFDIVINIDGYNEVALPLLDNISKKVFPFYPRIWFQRVHGLSEPEMLMMAGEISLLQKKRAVWAHLFEKNPLRYSILGNLLWKLYDQRLSNEITMKEIALNEHKIAKEKNIGYMTTGPSFHYDDDKELYQALADFWERCSMQMHRLCAANGIAYFHFLQPNQHLPNSKIIRKKEWKMAVKKAWPQYTKGVIEGYPILIRKGKSLVSQGVSFHDLTMIFKHNDELLYVDNCCHLNEKGYGIVAAAIGKAIRESDIVK